MRKYLPIVLFFLGLCLINSQAYAQYLVPGVGLENKLEIGKQIKPPAQENIWNDHPSGLQFKVDNKSIVSLIKCQTRDFQTDRNIRIGSPESDVLRWYGAAREKSQITGGMLYSYLGISFAIVNGQVQAIYIFPRYLLKK